MSVLRGDWTDPVHRRRECTVSDCGPGALSGGVCTHVVYVEGFVKYVY